MHPDTVGIAEHMRGFGLSVLGRAVYESTFAEMMSPFAHAMAVSHAAHGAEIVLKARIAREHPLLIFDQLPRSRTTSGPLTISELFEHGRTVAYQDLPERLWAATGVRMSNADRFVEFGRLRNTIIHFAVPDADLSSETLKFVFDVMEPLVDEFWDESIVPYSAEFDPTIIDEGYLEEQLARCDIHVAAATRSALDRR